MSTPADRIRPVLQAISTEFPHKDTHDAIAALAELERERDELRAKLAEYEQARTVATVFGGMRGSSWEPCIRESEDVDLPPPGTELIARPTRKGE